MKSKVAIFLLIFSLITIGGHGWAADKDCSCPKVQCGPCQKKVTVGKIVKFCDWGDINVCRKTVCENVNYYFKCLTNYKKNRTEDSDPKGDLEFAYDKGRKKQASKSKVSSRQSRRPASLKKTSSKSDPKTKPDPKALAAQKVLHPSGDQKFKLETPGRILVEDDSRVIIGPEYSDKTSGEVTMVSSGVSWLHRGELKKLSRGTTLFVGDEIINNSNKNKKISVQFENGSVKFTLAKKSKLQVQDPLSLTGRFQPFFYLVHGGLKLVVNMKEQQSLDVLAGQILIQAKNGQHALMYEMASEGLKVRAEAQTADLDVVRAQDLSGKKIQLKAGSFVSWVSEAPRELFNVDEKIALADEGFITPVFEMSESRKKQFGLIPDAPAPLFDKWKKTQLDGRQLASVGMTGEICQQPSAKFQQCAWSCENNPKGASSCLAEKQGTSCVRRVCNAAGQWGVPTAFASSYKDLCPSSGVRVGDCSP